MYSWGELTVLFSPIFGVGKGREMKGKEKKIGLKD